jgi:hypothetical protein
MTIHTEPHPLAGQVVTLPDGVTDPMRGMVIAGAEYRVEDWWDRVTGESWMNAVGNPAAIQYGARIIGCQITIPVDDEVVYGKIGSYGHLVHDTELRGAA